MYALKGKYFSHNSIKNGKRESPGKIAESQPLKVKSYDELLEDISKLANNNQDLFLLYRGQSKEYLCKENKKEVSSIISTFDRNPESINNYRKENRETLEKFTTEYLKNKKKMKNGIKRNPELIWTLFQHYEICPTPFLDLTQSLHVACSFAVLDSKEKTGIVYVFGFEELNPNITFRYSGGYQIIKLLGIVPSYAKRPLFQDGYLISNFPIDLNKNKPLFNLKSHLIGKFYFDNNEKFWGKYVKPYDKNYLYPKKDDMKKELEFMKQTVLLSEQ